MMAAQFAYDAKENATIVLGYAKRVV